MKKNKVRAGIIGSGFAARFHMDAIRKVYGCDVDVIGVFGRTAKNTKSFATEHQIEVVDHLDELMDNVDVVHVLVPAALHEEITIKALNKNVFPIVEKPFTGAFGGGADGFFGRTAEKEPIRQDALSSIQRMLEAEAKSEAQILYAENWVYAPAIQKEREVIEKTGAQLLWMHGEEAHSGSHSEAYGHWQFSGGGAMIGKGVHPLSAALYLKRVEGRARFNRPIRPASVTARTHSLTNLEGFVDAGHLRSDYHDVEDFAMIHVVFEDGTLATVFASEIVMGGVHNWLEVCANNHRTLCNLNPTDMMQTYNPVEKQFDDIYVVEKIGTKQGWAKTAPDEDHAHGFMQEIEAFYRTVAYDDEVESNSQLAADTISTVYSGYVSSERNGAEIKIDLL